MAPVYETCLNAPIPCLRNAVCAIGVFDGIHRGHQYLIDSTISEAEGAGVSSAIITFAHDPDEIFDGDALQKVMSNSERIEGLRKTGVDCVVAISFDKHIASIPAREFLDRLFQNNMPRSIHVGEDFRFGRGAKGDVKLLQEWTHVHGIELVVLNLLEEDGIPVKSTVIRNLLSDGRVEEADQLLGHPYSITGIVEQGRHVGRSMGISTANLTRSDSEQVLKDGVYAGYTYLKGQCYRTAISVGVPPSFEDATKPTIEAHILDFSGDLYGETLELAFIKRLGDMKKFDTVEDLMFAIEGYISETRKLPLT